MRYFAHLYPERNNLVTSGLDDDTIRRFPLSHGVASQPPWVCSIMAVSTDENVVTTPYLPLILTILLWDDVDENDSCAGSNRQTGPVAH